MENSCWICGKQDSFLAGCPYCGHTFCAEHRLPHQHACSGVDRSSRFGNQPGAGRTYRSPGNDEMFKVFFKNAAKGAAKGAANDFAYRTRRSFYSSPSMAILITCVAAFFIPRFLSVLFPGFLGIFYGLFQLYPNDLFSLPWTIITHMFLHASLSHLFFNMMVLFFFGRELERRIGNRTFLYVYFISGIVAAIGFSLTSSTTLPLVGASGAIMGVFATLTILAPELPVYVFFFPMRIKHALILFAILDFALMGTNDMVAHTAHLSGIAVGLYMGLRIKAMGRKRRTYGS
ncbi:membrane associated rhomboid family serine protease [Methanohalophilus levihalophilus]|uniref:rhomboid family intramembrane serine protease n=1 Tax=Methanohalophilus levihalophilus TaxID=1431282 RepID=UPI001AE60F4D|nr:rhomboid family intramembrane serine protease [Methanohalophilus levihalophilus]MBP2029809.1 membrane associated rhomboid family serine protease [Methanohalophilus levihalophilus]